MTGRTVVFEMLSETIPGGSGKVVAIRRDDRLEVEFDRDGDFWRDLAETIVIVPPEKIVPNV